MYSLLNEYRELLSRKRAINDAFAQLPKGYISKKTINGKQYSYLQAKVDGKLSSEYLKAEDVARVTDELAQRKQHEVQLPEINARLHQLEQAAELIGNGMDRALMLLRLSSGMDELQAPQKAQCVSFANAMNAIEGVPVSHQTADDIAQWQNGEKSYQEVFTATLQRYGFSVGV